MRVLFFALLAACGGSAPSGIRSTKASAPVCIKAPEESAPITHANGDAGSVQFCVGTAVEQCFMFDLSRHVLGHLDAEPTAQPPALLSIARLDITNPELKVCGTAGCKTLTPQVWPGAAPLHAATNGTVAAVMLGEAESGNGYVDVYDVMKAKKLVTFKYARGEFRCGELGMLGDTIYVGASACTKPSGRAMLYTIKGTKLASVGGTNDFGTYGNAYTQVDGNIWAFLEESGNQVALQDVASGKLVRSIDTSALFESSKLGNPGESAIVRLDGKHIAVIAGTPANGSVAVIDVASGAVQIVRAPLCS